jgi:dUTP pyrophosphatase
MTHFEIKKLDKRVNIPKLGTKGAAAFDLQAARIIKDNNKIQEIKETIELKAGETIKIGTGVAVHMNKTDVAAVILPRSGRGTKGLVVGNLVGLIDSDYQGELIVCLWNRNTEDSQIIEPLERIAQLMFIPVFQPVFTEVESFSTESERGEGGFGS